MSTRVTLLAAALAVLAGCGEGGAGGDGCDAEGCDADCQAGGYPGGLCQDDGTCLCVGGDADTDGDTDADTDADTDTGGFTSTPGTEAAVDRTEPCTQTDADGGQPRFAPQDPSVLQVCVGGVLVWAPVVCGYSALPDCDVCDPTKCISGETAQAIGAACICLNPCSVQGDESARCGAANERKCMPVDVYDGAQVFVCGGEL
jgi:hypothetical protein